MLGVQWHGLRDSLRSKTVVVIYAVMVLILLRFASVLALR